MYIMLPVEPADDIDVGNAVENIRRRIRSAGGAHPNGDETANNDGWARIQRNSAAAPQLAGAARFIKQACPK